MSARKMDAGKAILTVAVAGIWIGLCEFVRNQFLLVSQ